MQAAVWRWYKYKSCVYKYTCIQVMAHVHACHAQVLEATMVMQCSSFESYCFDPNVLPMGMR